MNITVYLGANLGNDPALPQAVQQLGRWIGESGNALVYGGSKSGLMGLLADSVLAAGGRVTGVEPKCFLDAELQHEGLTELIVTEDIPARKTKMIELGDAFIAFPGGTGTLEEITEVISKLSLGQLDAPCILYDLNGYYQPLHQLLQQMIAMGLSTPARQQNIAFAADLAQIRAILENDTGELTSQTRGTAVHGFVRRSFFIKIEYRGVRRRPGIPKNHSAGYAHSARGGHLKSFCATKKAAARNQCAAAFCYPVMYAVRVKLRRQWWKQPQKKQPR